MAALTGKILNRSSLFATVGAVVGFLVGNVWPVVRDELHWTAELTNKERDFVLKMIEIQRTDSPDTAQSTAVLTGVVAKRYLDPQFAVEFTDAITSRAMVIGTGKAASAAAPATIPAATKDAALVATTPTTVAPTQSPAVAAVLAQTDQAAQFADSFSSAGVKQQPASVREALRATVARAFVHVGVESDRRTAGQLKDSLGKVLGGDWRLYGVELVPGFKGSTQVRYFYPADRDQAQKLTEALAATFPGVRCQRIPGYENRAGVKPRLFEVWLAPGATPGGQTTPRPACN